MNSSLIKQKQESQITLKTKQQRNLERNIQLSKYKKCFVRIRFPDRSELEGTFHPKENMRDVYLFVAECLRDQRAANHFHLYVTPPKQVILPSIPIGLDPGGNSTSGATPGAKVTDECLRDLGFLPATLFYFGLNQGKINQSVY